jgi:hypothetical protein
VVAILDRRVQTRGYGGRFLRALPNSARVHDLTTLGAWLETGAESGEHLRGTPIHAHQPSSDLAPED